MSFFKNEIQEFLDKREINYQKNISFSTLSYLKLGEDVELAAFPETYLDFCEILRFSFKKSIPFRVIGRMSNVLPPGGVFNGVVISTVRLNRIHIEKDTVTVESGVFLPSLAKVLLPYGMSGFEELSGIPASVGGAVYMNAGAYGREISDTLLYATVYDKTKDRALITDKSELDFSYRKSRFSKRELYLLNATFKCTLKPMQEISQKVKAYAQKRRLTQPLSYPSLGSVFKRYGGNSAGYYIDTAGLKGFSIGDAEVSKMHANFFINKGSATRAEYFALIKEVKRRVYDFHGIMLCEEIEYF